MKYIPLILKTDFSLLTNLIKVDSLIDYALNNNINTLSICDTNLYSSVEFYLKCHKNNLKPLIGLEINYQEYPIYIFAKNYNGYLELIQISKDVNLIKTYFPNIIIIIPNQQYDLFKELSTIYDLIFLGYSNEQEKRNSLILTDKIIYLNEVLCLLKNDAVYLNYLNMIRLGETELTTKMINYQDKVFAYNNCNEDDLKRINDFISLINIEFPNNKLLPKYDEKLNNPYQYLVNLSMKGLSKRLNNEVSSKYSNRLQEELSVIYEMGFVDYFLIVYDYVLYAKKNHIMVGPGRGSAAGSLVSYSLGITDIDPIKYNLLFERFLNKMRITMPDIDIDFEDTKRDQIKEYVRDKYGIKKVGLIMTYSTMASKQVIIDVSETMSISPLTIKSFTKLIDPHKKLIDNLKIKTINDFYNNHQELKKLIEICLRLEDLKKTTSIHAAGLVIASDDLTKIVPTYETNDFLVIGVTKDYLESIGLLKMDFLGLSNLSIIHDCLSILPSKLDINMISLEDSKTYNLFANGDTFGIFQFESEGIKNFIKRLKPTCLSDLYVALALYRPGPISNIDSFIKRREGKEEIVYLDKKLESILKDTYGIIVYQEQIMEIFRSLANYSYAEADVVRKSISKKKVTVLENEKKKFIDGCQKNNIDNITSEAIFNLIIKFADYGFNKSHSVAYSLISYYLAYLKANYLLYFIINMLNRNVGGIKTISEWITYAQGNGIKVIGCDINLSQDKFIINNNNIIIPLSIIKNLNDIKIKKILEKRNEANFIDIFDFVSRTKSFIGKEDFINMIYTGCFDCFNNRHTLIQSIDILYNYASLVDDISTNIIKPLLINCEEFSISQRLEYEVLASGLYISDHPTVSYFTSDHIKAKNLHNYFDKNVKTVILVDRIKDIKTKKNEIMYFIDGSDDTGKMEFVLFPNKVNLISKIEKGKIIYIMGKVTKRLDKYGIIINDVKSIKE